MPNLLARKLSLALALHGLWPHLAARAEATRCDIPGYAADLDPRGTNLRAGPGTTDAIVARLPPPAADGADTYAAEFRIIGAQGNWLFIRDAWQGGYGVRPRRKIFAGFAWVSTGLVSFTINGAELRSAPDSTAPVTAILHGRLSNGAAWGPDGVVVERVHGCQGRFADVRVRLPDGRQLRGWATGICSNQVTTCS